MINDTGTFRKEHMQLTELQSKQIADIKRSAEYLEMCFKEYKNREMSLALTKLEEAVMWAVKGITSITNVMRGAEVQVDTNPTRD